MANKRRPRGDGSVYQRKDGRWVAAYAKAMPDGSTKMKFLYAPTRATAAARLREALAARAAGMASDDSGLTVGAYLDRWLASVRDTVKDRTLLRHEGVVRRDLKPALGSVRLGRLDAMRIAALYQSKLGEGYAARTVRNMHATLHKALGQAVRWRLVERNVSGDVDPPRAVGNEIVPLTAEEARTLLGEAEGDPLEALYVLALTTGLRQGGRAFMSLSAKPQLSILPIIPMV